MTRVAAITVAAASLAAALSWSGLYPRAATPSQPAWTELAWPFPSISGARRSPYTLAARNAPGKTALSVVFN